MDSRQRNNILRGVVALAALVGGGWFLRTRLSAGGEVHAAGGKGAAQGDRVVPVVATAVVRKDVPIFLDGIGNVVAFSTVTVRPQVDGKLDTVNFREGQEVHKGDVLAEIDPRPFLIQLASASAALARDKAQLDGGKRNLERYRGLAQSGLVTQQQVDDQLASVAQFEGTTHADQAQIDSARLMLDYAKIAAPIDGVTGVRLIDAGNIVHANDPNGLVVITQLNPIAILFTLPQDDLPRITKEMANETIEVEALNRDGSQKIAVGKLELVDNQINQATATIRLKAIFPNDDKALWPNQLVKARMLLTTRKDALVVPAAVVQRGPQGPFAYVVGADKKVTPRPLHLGPTIGDIAVVEDGLEAGEQVVVDGQYQLRPGSRVNVRPPEASHAKTASAAPTAAPPAAKAER